MPYKRGFSVKKRFKKEKLDKTKMNNNEHVVQVNPRHNSIYFVQKFVVTVIMSSTINSNYSKLLKKQCIFFSILE